MKRILLTLAILGLGLANLAEAQVHDKIFFSGAHLGMTIDQCNAYYFAHGGPTGPVGAPLLGAIPLGGATPAKAIADAGACWHSGAPQGEEVVDFRTNSNPAGQRRVLVHYRKSDRKIVSVCYWRVDDGNEKSFSKQERRYLTKLNSGQGPLVTHVYDDGEFEVTTPEEDKLQSDNVRALNDQAGVPSNP